MKWSTTFSVRVYDICKLEIVFDFVKLVCSVFLYLQLLSNSIFTTMTSYEYDNRYDLVYEIDEKGNKELVRSTESRKHALLRFRNKTTRPIDAWWRNYRGEKCHYIRIKPGTYNDINSFTTHPWEFTDAVTGERYVVNNKPIFRPPEAVGGMNYRTNWNITISVRTLKKITMLAINEYISDENAVNSLEIPRMLVEELRALIIELRKPIPPY